MYGNFTENFRVYGELGQDFRIATFVRILSGILWIESQDKPDSVHGGPLRATADTSCQAIYL